MRSRLVGNETRARTGSIVTKVAIAAALALAACATPSTVESFCARAQQCNDIPDGASEQDCIDIFGKCVDGLTTSQRSDWERMIDDCVSDNSCQLFERCYGAVPWC
jgi:hypothetical protein